MSDKNIQYTDSEIIIQIDTDNDNCDFLDSFFLDCPFLTDLNCCEIIKHSEINDCPERIEDDNGLTKKVVAPKKCPLRKRKIVVQKLNKG